jgi:radical SAM superfamily enzyme YgiQ (UPF0313 family)
MDRLREGEETIPAWACSCSPPSRASAATASSSIDAKTQGPTLEEVCRRIVARVPTISAFPATTISVTNAARIAERIKALLPDVVTILGGPARQRHSRTHPDRVSSIDYGIVGEGEISLFALLERLEAGPGDRRRAQDWSTAATASVRAAPARAVHRGPRRIPDARVGPAARLPAPLPAVDLQLPAHADGDADHVARLPVYVHVLRPLDVGKKGRMHSVEYVVGLCRHLVSLGVRHITFVDDLFTVRKKRVVELCEAFLDEGFTFSWSCNSHPNLLDFPTLQLMKRAGCWQIAYGIESGSQKVLDVVKREVRIPNMRNTLRMTRRPASAPKGYMMIGHPTEDIASLNETSRVPEARRARHLPDHEVHALARLAVVPDDPRLRHVRRRLGAHERDELRVHPARPRPRKSSRRTSTTCTGSSTPGPGSCGGSCA